MSVDDLKAIVVDGFPLSKRRGMLWSNLLTLLESLKNAKIPCKVWLDGSFLTKKVEPDDIDFVVDVPVHITDNPSPTQRALLKDLADKAFKKTKKMHSFVMLDAPVMHKEYTASQRMHSQWKKDFGFAYVSREPKGIAVLAVQP